MGKGWEERYFEDILPGIKAYGDEEVFSFTSSDIAKDLERYSPQEVGKVLKYMVKDGSIENIEIIENNPKNWKFTVPDNQSLEEMGEELERDSEAENQDKEQMAEQVLDEKPTTAEEGLYKEFKDRLENQNLYNTTAETIRKMKGVIDRRKPEVNPDIRDLGAQEYGKLRKNIDEVYEGLEEVSKERSSLFRTKDVKEKVSDVRAAEIGVVLSGLAAAGLVESYSDRDGYVPESIDLGKIQEFRRAVNNSESVEDLQDSLNFSDKDE